MARPFSPAPDFNLLARKRYMLEALCWVVGLVLLAWLEPSEEHLFSLCPFSWVLENSCPGCGLGHALAWLFRGELAASWQAHPLGIPALLLLSWRVWELLKQYVYLKNFYRKSINQHDQHL